jgi:hypothetical protein
MSIKNRLAQLEQRIEDINRPNSAQFIAFMVNKMKPVGTRFFYKYQDNDEPVEKIPPGHVLSWDAVSDEWIPTPGPAMTGKKPQGDGPIRVPSGWRPSRASS